MHRVKKQTSELYSYVFFAGVLKNKAFTAELL